MDNRQTLASGYQLSFPGMLCTIEEVIGRGSNAIVYKGFYHDQMNQEAKHTVLIKELFPFHPKGAVFRNADDQIIYEEEAAGMWELHKHSFEEGNRIHLKLLERYPDKAGANLNTFPKNNTWYTILGFSGGRSLSQELRNGPGSLRPAAVRILGILDALEDFHNTGYLHLDIAPDNVMIIGKGIKERIVLIDYNSVRQIKHPKQNEFGTVSIKAGYTPPEVRTGNLAAVSEASDLFSVAAVFYHCISGTPLTPCQMIRKSPPDVSECPALVNAPDTVKAMVREILERGLKSLPRQRYHNVEEMRTAVSELIDRIDGVGITHWALWEAGRRNVLRMIQDNPSYSYITDKEKMFPAEVRMEDGKTITVEDYFDWMCSPDGQNSMLTAQGGMGKTTALMRTVISRQNRYSYKEPALICLSLYGSRQMKITDRILEHLHFREQTGTYEEARRELRKILDEPLDTLEGNKPVLVLLLDGWNEISEGTDQLLEELIELSNLHGIRILISSRTEDSTIPFGMAQLVELREKTVKTILNSKGILFPENPRMQQILRNPQMLSVFITSSEIQESQLTDVTREDLLSVYFDALLVKEEKNLPDDSCNKWPSDAAMKLVLPAIAGEMVKKGGTQNDQEMLRVVEKCFKILSDRMVMRAFPEWTGRSKAIKGDSATAEEWFGLIIHDILWKRMGLLVRTAGGEYQISHQIFCEYMAEKNLKIIEAVRRKKIQKKVVIGVSSAAIVAILFLLYYSFIRPRPYDEECSFTVLSYGEEAYYKAGQQYEAIRDLTDASLSSDGDESTYERALSMFESTMEYLSILDLYSEDSEYALTRLFESGKYFEDSRKALDETAYLQLLDLANSRNSQYMEYADILTYVVEDDKGRRRYGEEYPELLSELIETDADIAGILYQIACGQHVNGLLSGDSVYAAAFQATANSSSGQNQHTPDTIDETVLYQKLSILQNERNRIENEIRVSGVLADTEK